MPDTSAENRRAPYILGYGDTSVNWMAARSVENHAGFFIPFLKSGMKLLDCGCGPGTISVGLAQLVAPAEMVAMDIEPSQVDLTRASASECGIDTMTCREGSILAIPFEDDTFDAVFVSAVVGNLAHPQQALAETYRVLKSGGVLGIREFDHGGNMIHPSSPVLEKSVAIYKAVREEHHHTKEFGRALRGALHQAGFQLLQINASYETYGEPGRVKAQAQRIANIFRESLGAQAVKAGLSDVKEIETIIHSWEIWGEDSRAFFAAAWVDAVARKL